MKHFIFGKISTWIIISSLILIFTSCSEDSDLIFIKDGCRDFLYIENFEYIVTEAELNDSDLDLTPEEHDILMEVYSRILKNCKRIDGQPDFSSISAESLNIDPIMYQIVLNALAPYMTGEKVVGEDLPSVPRLKTKAEGNIDYGWSGNLGGTPIGGGYDSGQGLGGGNWSGNSNEEYIRNNVTRDEMFNIICTAMSFSFFERQCFYWYWYCEGADMFIKDVDWLDMKTYADDALNCKDWESLKEECDRLGTYGEFKENGGVYRYYECSVSFYNASEYNYALGTATVAYGEYMAALGVWDFYNFDRGKSHSIIAEGLTVGMSILEQIFHPCPFEMGSSFYWNPIE